MIQPVAGIMPYMLAKEHLNSQDHEHFTAALDEACSAIGLSISNAISILCGYISADW